jgi:site-specific DNA-methyltransferase (adenine-specific)
MGKGWDRGVPGVEFWRKILRVAKPGAMLLAFGGTRTYHRLMCAIEDAEWEIRDCLSWLYGTGFPKSLNIAKAIASGSGRPEDIRRMQLGDEYQPSGRGRKNYDNGGGSKMGNPVEWQAPADVEQWNGWGTALKPAWEPIIMARKPLIGTVAANVLEYGTGGINIDGCRVTPTGERLGGGTEKWTRHQHEGWHRPWMDDEKAQEAMAARSRANVEKATQRGRWPANVALDEEAATILDEQTGNLPAGVAVQRNRDGGVHNQVYGATRKPPAPDVGFEDTGGASRFFYCAKASRSERDAGLDDIEKRKRDDIRKEGDPGGNNPRNRGAREVANSHPTVKPVALMRWLCRLVTPKNGIVLDPFAGSGSTGIAAVHEGFRFVGIDITPEYVEIAKARIEAALHG